MFLLSFILQLFDLSLSSSILQDNVITARRGAPVGQLSWTYQASNTCEITWMTYLEDRPKTNDNLIPIWRIKARKNAVISEGTPSQYKGRLSSVVYQTRVSLQISNVTTNDSNTYICIARDRDSGNVTLPPIQLLVKDVPGRPEITRVSPGSNSLRLWWSPPSSDGGSPITHFTVKIQTRNKSEMFTFNTNGQEESYTVHDIFNNSTHYAAMVSAWNSLGESEDSEGYLGKVGGQEGPPDSPRILNNKDEIQNQTTILLRWTQPCDKDNPIMHYLIQYKEAMQPTWSIIAIPSNNTLEHHLSLDWGRKYQVQVYAWNIKGYSPPGDNCTIEIADYDDIRRDIFDVYGGARKTQSIIMYAVVGALMVAGLLKLWSIYKRRKKRKLRQKLEHETF